MRLNRLMAMKGICSRREADDFIKAGYVEVDGRSAILGEVIDESKIDRSLHVGKDTTVHAFITCLLGWPSVKIDLLPAAKAAKRNQLSVMLNKPCRCA